MELHFTHLNTVLCKYLGRFKKIPSNHDMINLSVINKTDSECFYIWPISPSHFRTVCFAKRWLISVNIVQFLILPTVLWSMLSIERNVCIYQPNGEKWNMTSWTMLFLYVSQTLVIILTNKYSALLEVWTRLNNKVRSL